MTLLTAIYAHLAANAGVAALASTRIYPMQAPQIDANADISPSIVFSLDGRRDEVAVNASRVISRTTWTFACLAATPDAAHGLNDAVIACLANHRGTLGGSGGVAVQYVELLDSSDFVDDLTLGFYIVTSTFEFTV
jgi:hypothetical protein